jgi:hypothetical protein
MVHGGWATRPNEHTVDWRRSLKMSFVDPQELAAYVIPTAAHECGHMTVLFKADRLAGLNFYPHEAAWDETKGVVQTDAKTELGKEDCVSFAGGLVAELICFGLFDSPRLDDDRHQVQQLAGQPLEHFALEAYEIIKQSLVFFALLRQEVQKNLHRVLHDVYSLPNESFARLPTKISVVTLAEVEHVYRRAQAALAGFPRKA